MTRNYALIMLAAAASLSADADTIVYKGIEPTYISEVKSFVALGDTAGVKSEIDIFADDYTPNIKSYQKAAVPAAGTHLVNATRRFNTRGYGKVRINVVGLNEYKVKLDGRDYDGGEIALRPATHTISVNYAAPGDTLKSIGIISYADGILEKDASTDKRMITLEDIIYGRKIIGAEISADGRYIIAVYSDTDSDGKTSYDQQLYDASTGRPLYRMPEMAEWMPRTSKYMVERNDYRHGRHYVAVDPATRQEEIIADHLPEGECTMAPTEDFLVFRMVRKGPEEDPDIYRVIEPDDRQPGWRDRAYPAIYSLKTRTLQPVALSRENLDVADISDDGKKLLLMSSTRRLTERPTTLYSLISLDLESMEADTIVHRDGFIAGAYFSPDAKNVVVTGSPEAFGRVGCTLPRNAIPSMYDYQLYLVDVTDKSVKPLTRNLDPSVNGSAWNRSDGKIYITATDKDKYTLYRLDPLTAEACLIPTPENVVEGISAPRSSSIIAWWGQSDSAPRAMYTLDTASGESTLLDRPGAELLDEVAMPACNDWTFRNSRGDTVYGIYYLPDNFDPSKKYPMIVNYYGGCSPCTRTFESRYPLHVYAALGYVVLQLQPSGATGFGQEWSGRHVSTAGKGVAEDIIEGTRQFCKEMPYVDGSRIGCIGASYGGFMTQYLQTVTDIFAAAVSHAGISDHASYWGEGWWGYSYSEVSMGDDLPWTNPDLYVKQSPLYNADKVHTPILFLHGDADTNVPVGESIQMFTALQRLGRESALVQVKDQNHHILDLEKRKKWQDTIFAWFAKYLRDDPAWWDALYPPY